MTPETPSELKSLLEKATPGEWHHYYNENDEAHSISDKRTYEVADAVDKEDAELICALRNNAPDLIKAVEQRDRYRTALEWIGHRAKEYTDSYNDDVKKEGDEADLASIEFNSLAKAAREGLKDTKQEASTV